MSTESKMPLEARAAARERLAKAAKPRPTHRDVGTHMDTACGACDNLDYYIKCWDADQRAFLFHAGMDLPNALDEIERLETTGLEDRIEKAIEEEQGRWQQPIYKMCLEIDPNTDGSGTDTGDPLDVTLTEIGQCFGVLNERLELADKLAEAVGKFWNQSRQALKEPEALDEVIEALAAYRDGRDGV